ncbi:unnamed protein product [Arctogadus glacialis]
MVCGVGEGEAVGATSDEREKQWSTVDVTLRKRFEDLGGGYQSRSLCEGSSDLLQLSPSSAQTFISSDLHLLRPSSAQTVISSDIHQLPLQQSREEVLHVHNVSEGHLEWGLEPGLKHMIAWY